MPERIEDISQILSSREGLELIVKQLGDHDDPGSATESNGHSVQGPDGKFYKPLPLQPAPETTKEDSGLTNDNYEYGSCGLGICKPKCSQRLANLYLFSVIYGVSGIWMMTLTSFLGSQVTSIERHLGMTTSQIGLILSCNEIGYMVFVILGSHLGKYTHIPVFVSISGIIFGLATVSMAFGRLETPRVWQDTTASGLQTTTLDLQDSPDKYLCNPAYPQWDNSFFTSANSSTVSTDMSVDLNPPHSISWVFYLLAFCSMTGGAVKSYRNPLMTYYIESNVVDKSRSGLLLGIAITAMILGPPIALFLGSFSNSLPVDLQETTMSKHDHRWVSAWWLGLIIIGVACIVCSAPIMFFPRHMRKLKAKIAPGATETTSLRVMMLDLPKSLLRCFRRPIYVLVLIFYCVEGFSYAGSFAYIQKYMEIQFSKTSQEISAITGVLTLFTIVLGTFFGGCLTTKLKLELRGCAFVVLVVAVITTIFQCFNLAFGCKNSDIVGIEGNRTLSMDVCDCSQDIFIICGENQVNYLSPCVAGCRNATADMMFSNCTSINNGQAIPGMCDLDCHFFIPFLIIYGMAYFVGALSIIPGVMLNVRSIEHRDQSLASGTFAFCQTLLGILPAPIFFGKIIDMSCSQWSPSGSCLLYDREQFRYRYFGVYLGIRFVSLGVMAVVLWLAHRDARKESSKQPDKTPEQQQL